MRGPEVRLGVRAGEGLALLGLHGEDAVLPDAGHECAGEPCGPAPARALGDTGQRETERAHRVLRHHAANDAVARAGCPSPVLVLPVQIRRRSKVGTQVGPTSPGFFGAELLVVLEAGTREGHAWAAAHCDCGMPACSSPRGHDAWCLSTNDCGVFACPSSRCPGRVRCRAIGRGCRSHPRWCAPHGPSAIFLCRANRRTLGAPFRQVRTPLPTGSCDCHLVRLQSNTCSSLLWFRGPPRWSIRTCRGSSTASWTRSARPKTRPGTGPSTAA